MYVYQVIIHLFSFFIKIFSFFNPKAKLWLEGRKKIFNHIQDLLKENENRIWIHTASLGEFEQGRPIIEEIKKRDPSIKIVLTFFSPSGYEVRKNYNQADYVFYLPLDTKSNAKRFIETIRPTFVIFVKYEFWLNYLNYLKLKKIPTYLVSAIFRENQLFFKWYGSWYRQALKAFSHLFVQNSSSQNLLESINIHNTTITGDTRFDRVKSIAMQTKTIPVIESFKQSHLIIIAGSTWPPDEEIIAKYINQSDHPVKYIIAPHEVHIENIQHLSKLFTKKILLFSKASENAEIEADVLIIDNIGMLSSIYKYGQIAYIGGGFGVGIHNILEAATFGLPVIFGPNYMKFQEAKDLIALEGAFSIKNYDEFYRQTEQFLNDKEYLSSSGKKAAKFIQDNIGATDKILQHILNMHVPE
jgi:3-deoxy-D-manno-octulosonic-acid transferase